MPQLTSCSSNISDPTGVLYDTVSTKDPTDLYTVVRSTGEKSSEIAPGKTFNLDQDVTEIASNYFKGASKLSSSAELTEATLNAIKNGEKTYPSVMGISISNTPKAGCFLNNQVDVDIVFEEETADDSAIAKVLVSYAALTSLVVACF